MKRGLPVAKTKVGVVGTGWRAGFFINIMRTLGDSFETAGVVYHSPQGKARAASWGASLFDFPGALLEGELDFVLLCADKGSMEGLLKFYASKNMPVLFETFAAENVEQLRRLYGELGGARIQCAEQYPLQPLNAARIALAHSGLLGNIYQVQTSIPNGYHAAAVQRKILGTGRRLPESVRAFRYRHKMTAGPGRQGDPLEEKLVEAGQTLFQFDWGGMQGLNDVEDNQHRSFFRTQHWVIRGERGEVRDEDVYYLKELTTPCAFHLERVSGGAGPNLEGLYLRGVRGGDRGWYYQNPFMPARLFDDEIASAAVLMDMAAYVRSGTSFYPLEESLMDQYLALLIEKAVEEEKPIGVKAEAWTE
jgi:predicted dehydrogenase